MGRRRKFWGALALGLGVALLAPACVPSDNTQGFATIGCDGGEEPIVVVVNSKLDPSCTYTGGFVIRASNVVFDCRGALIDGGRRGVGIQVETPVDVSMSNVRVRHCRVNGFLNSMRVTRVGFRALEAGHEYDNHLSDVVIERSVVTNSRGVGIFVDGYVSRVRLENLHVEGTGSSGIYLEAGSRENVVANNTIVNNGFNENGPGGQTFNFGGVRFRFWGTGREGLSVDGSSDNRIYRNVFEGNSAGAIFLYTNCSEFVNEKPERFFPRRTKAERNVIRRNEIRGGLIGIWVGSRQSENTLPMDCANPAYVEGPANRITLDYANDNTLRDNVFDDVTYGVRVEDDNTRVIDNTFVAPDADHHAVIVGTKYRGPELGRPVTGTVLARNDADIAGNTHPYRWTYGHGDLTVNDNTANGAEVGICEGVPIPINQFIFVLALAVEPEGAPVTPAPDLTVETIGPLPPCP
jgi:parallel beta-helix repeat protein